MTRAAWLDIEEARIPAWLPDDRWVIFRNRQQPQDGIPRHIRVACDSKKAARQLARLLAAFGLPTNALKVGGEK